MVKSLGVEDRPANLPARDKLRIERNASDTGWMVYGHTNPKHLSRWVRLKAKQRKRGEQRIGTERAAAVKEQMKRKLIGRMKAMAARRRAPRPAAPATRTLR